MNRHEIARRPTLALVARVGMAAALLAGAATAAHAAQDVHWDVTGVFADGGTLSGFFDVDKAGVLFDWNIVTTAGTGASPFAGETYENGLSGATSGNADSVIDVGFHFNNVLNLAFASSLFTPIASNALLVAGSPGPSFECIGSFSCGNGVAGTNRFLISGSAVASGTTISGAGGGGGNGPGVPEPASWALMILGFGATGALLRTRRLGLRPGLSAE
jgi:hypothetical protein